MAGLLQIWWEGVWSAFQVVIVHAVSTAGVTAEANAADAMRVSGSRNTK